jgi:hypothetical protein
VKKIIALSALAIAAALPSAPAAAQNLAVKNIVGLCTRGNVSQGVSDPSCIAYLEGFAPALRVAGRPANLAPREAACVPESSTVDQKVLALYQYVQSDPKTLELPAGTGLYRALARAYPCTR